MMVLAGCCHIMKAQPTDNEYSVIPLTESREWPEENGGETPIRRSISLPSVYAYIYNKVVILEFMETYPDVTVTVTNEDTGEIIYWESFTSLSVFNLDLGAEKKGIYIIRIIWDETLLEGSFNV